MKKTVDIISAFAFIFIICLVGAWDSGYITASNAMWGVIFTISCVIASGFVCSLIYATYSTHQRQYGKKAYR